MSQWVDILGMHMAFHEVKWCQHHDIAWALHAGLGLAIDRCESGFRWVEDKSQGWKVLGITEDTNAD